MSHLGQASIRVGPRSLGLGWVGLYWKMHAFSRQLACMSLRPKLATAIYKQVVSKIQPLYKKESAHKNSYFIYNLAKHTWLQPVTRISSILWIHRAHSTTYASLHYSAMRTLLSYILASLAKPTIQAAKTFTIQQALTNQSINQPINQ